MNFSHEKTRPVGRKEGYHLDQSIGAGNWTIKHDSLDTWGNFNGRIILTNTEPREIISTNEAGFVMTRAPYDFREKKAAAQ